MFSFLDDYILQKGQKLSFYAFVSFLIFEIVDFDILSFISFVMALFFLYIYRIPKRYLLQNHQGSLLSVIDAKVESCQEETDEKYGQKVVFSSSMLKSGVLRVPFDCEVVSISIQRGTKFDEKSVLFDKLNEKLEICFKNQEDEIKIYHILKRTCFDIDVFVKPGQKLYAGDIYGFASNAITTVYLPKDFNLELVYGVEVYASQTTIGYFKK